MHSSLQVALAETATLLAVRDNQAFSVGGSEHSGMLPAGQELLLEYRNGQGRTRTARAFVSAQGELKGQSESVDSASPTIFISTRARPVQENAELFSELEAVGQQDEILSPLQLLEPRLKRLTLLLVDGVTMIHGDIGLSRLVPLSLMGEGMVHLSSMLLAIAKARGGTVLIDEVEKGLHHSVMAKVWEAIGSAARKLNTQVFATTHSWESIQFANQAFGKDGDFRLHRLEKIKDEIRAITYSEESFDAAMKFEMEVR